MAAVAKPQDFFLGVRDFFAVLVPGATFLLLLPEKSLAVAGFGRSGLALLGVVIAAYLVGSVASAAGAALDHVVDPLLASRRFRDRFGATLRRRQDLAERLQAELLGQCGDPLAGAEGRETVKDFWWTYLRLNSAEAMTELDRIEGTQKLFRSLVAVFLALALIAFPPTAAWMHPSLAAGHRFATGHYLAFAAVSAVLYAAARSSFLHALYRLAAACCIRRDPPPPPGGGP